jgi:hypothetical protein
MAPMLAEPKSITEETTLAELREQLLLFNVIAMKLVREGAHPGVEVWHRWRGASYMQGVADEDGWSNV